MNIRHLWGENLIIPFSWKRPRGRADLEKAVSWQEALEPQSQETRGLDNAFFRSSWPRGRGIVLVFFLLLSVFIVYSRVFQLQIVYGVKNRSLSEGNRLRTQIIRPPRGVIYDREGQVLAENIPGFQVVWDPAKGKSLNPSGFDLGKLAEILEVSVEILEQRLGENRRVVLKAGLSRDQILAVETQFFCPGLVTEVSPMRYYPYGEAFAHVFGFTGEGDSVEPSGRVGKSGLEKEFDLLLRGRPGKNLLEVDVLGKAITEVAKKDAEVGQDLRTALDLGLQRRSFEALAKGVERSGASGGAVVAEDPRTGEILALVSFPSFDPNRFVLGLSGEEFELIISHPQKPLFNRALSGAYPPGSVFKLVTAAAALEEGIVTPETAVDCRGAIFVGAFSFRGWKSEGHGRISLVEALAKSCDIYFYTVGGGYGGQRGVGPEKLAHWAHLFGLGELLDIEQPWEGRGIIPDPGWKERVRGEPWFLGNTYHFAIGQGDVLTTPLQITNMVSAIANGGKLLKPTLIFGKEPEVLREGFVLSETLSWIVAGMRGACQPGGTAYPFFTFPTSCAGKTGTAETGWGDDTHAWFTVFAPAENPQIVLTVFLENGGEGSHDAAPVAREILDWYFSEDG